TTSSTGASSRRATSAVDDGWPSAAPSNSPITPSMTSRSAPAAARAAKGPMRSGPDSQGSRVRGGRPVARAWEPGPMKSGPRFAAARATPRRRSAATSPVATVVLPTPEWVPATTTRGPSGLTSVLDALAGVDPDVHGVLDLRHLGDGVGHRDQLLGG